jgi:hypothetical protein
MEIIKRKTNHNLGSLGKFKFNEPVAIINCNHHLEFDFKNRTTFIHKNSDFNSSLIEFLQFSAILLENN